MPELPDVTYQPLPQEYDRKREVFARLTEMAVQMQHMRRAMGYQWLEGGMSGEPLGGIERVIVHAQQSGLIIVTAVDPNPALHMDPVATSSLREFHRSLIPREAPAEFRWDEAMFAPAQS